MKKYWFKYLVYLSLIFLVIALIKSDYLEIPKFFNYYHLLISFALLFLGFILLCVRWFMINNISKSNIKFYDAISSVGLSVFAKYIPGKFLVVVGKIGYINKKYDYPNDKLITYALMDQFIAIWMGIAFGIVGLNYIINYPYIGYLILAFWLLLSFFIFSYNPYLWTQNVLNRIFKKKKIELPRIPLNVTIKIIPFHAIYWFVIANAFYFLISSMLTTEVSYLTGYIFPIAVSIGIISIIAPGGIGVRETIIVGYLNFMGIDINDAVTISVASRLWFLIGEIFIFILGFVTDRLFPGK